MCGYRLDHLHESGTCPECGSEYRPVTTQGRDLPGIGEIVLRFGWPVVLLALVIALGLSPLAPRGGGVVFSFGLLAFFSCYANIPVQLRLLRRSGLLMSGAPPARHDYWMAIMIVFALCGPILLFIAIALVAGLM